MQQSDTPKSQSFDSALRAAAIAGVLGLGSGALMALVAPSDKFSWVGLAVVPLWFLLEIFFEGVVETFGARARMARVASTVAVVAGFYIAWFALRGIAP
jgi:hypothetical protein